MIMEATHPASAPRMIHKIMPIWRCGKDLNIFSGEDIFTLTPFKKM
jgi:hypothetical protein